MWFTEMATVSKEMHSDILRRLRDAVRRKRPEKQRTNSWFLFHDNAPAHRSVLVKVLAENNVTTPVHPPYSLDLAAADFYLFRRLKSALYWRRLCDGTDINTNATEELKKLSQNGFRNVSNNFTVAGRRV